MGFDFKTKSIRAFIGAKDYEQSRMFYRQLGFIETQLDKMSYFQVTESMGFYLQDSYVKDWVNNSMLFLEIDDVESCRKELMSKGLHEKYKYVRFSEIRTFDHGRQLFMHDPSGVLWHFCEFNKKDKSS